VLSGSGPAFAYRLPEGLIAAPFPYTTLFRSGLTALEALAAGTPVVGYRAGAVAEVVGDAGLLVDDRDAGALGEALVSLLGDASRSGEHTSELQSRFDPV